MQVGIKRASNGQNWTWWKAGSLVVGWLIIITLAKDVWQTRIGFGRIKESESNLALEEARNGALKQKLELVNTDAYKETLIRLKLNMQKEGEVTVVLPKKPTEEAGVVATEPQKQNWQKWLDLLRG